MFGIGSIFKSITKFLLDKDNQRFILLVLFALAVVAAVQYRDSYKDQIQETERQVNNIEALQDSVREYRTENGKIGSERRAFQTTAEQLKQLSDSLSQALEEERGNVKVITQTEFVTVRDTVYLESTVSMLDPSTYKLSFNLNESYGGSNFRDLEGYTSFKWDTTSTQPYDGETVITKDQIGMDLITGVREEEGNYSIFIRTNYPNVQFGNIEGALIDLEQYTESDKSRWGVGISSGYGYSLGNSTFSPYIGIGVNYNLIEF